MLTPMRASADQRNRTKTEEGLRLEAYKDTVGIYTIGFGHAATNPRPVRGMRIVYQKDEHGGELKDPITGKLIPVMDEFGKPVLEFYQGRVCEGVTITQAEADRLFDEDLEEVERGICECVDQQLEQHQFDALIDFCHQYGLQNFKTSTLRVKINFNPTAPAVLHQFMRWTRAGGEHQEYVWRRSARRCCVWNGTPIPQALWRKNGFPFAVNADDQIDYSITPTIEKLIEWGKKRAEPPRFDPSQPLPSTPEKPAASVEAGGGSVPARDSEPASAAAEKPAAGVGGTQLGQPSASPPIAPAPSPVPATEAAAPVREAGEPPVPVSPGTAGGGGGVPSSPPPTISPPPIRPPPKNPAHSTTIWGGMFTALAPQFDQIGNILIAKSGAFGPPFLVLGIIMIVLGRVGAVQPLSNAAPIRNPS